MLILPEELESYRDIVIDDLLWDRVEIKYPEEVVSEDGTTTKTFANRSYRGSMSIPARVDYTRYVKAGDIFGQEQTISEYSLNLPFDCPVFADDTIFWEGAEMEVLKIMQYGSKHVVKILIVAHTD